MTSEMSKIQNKTPYEVPDEYNLYPPVPPSMEMYKTDYSKLIGKPFFVSAGAWPASGLGSVVGHEIFSLTVPYELVINNNLLRTPFEASCLYRSKVKLVISINGTPMHSGCLLAAVLPATQALVVDSGGYKLEPFDSFNQLMQAPHGFLFANQANELVLNVPNYHSTTLKSTIDADVDKCSPRTTMTTAQDYAILRIFIMNTLQTGTGGSTPLTISVHAIFDELEFYVPKAASVYPAPPAAPQGTLPDNTTIQLSSSKRPVVEQSKTKFKLKKKYADTQSLDIERDVIVSTSCFFITRLLWCIAEYFAKDWVNKVRRPSIAEPQSDDMTTSATPSTFSLRTTKLFDNVATYAKETIGDFIDRGRGFLRTITGLHNPNISTPSSKVYAQQRNVAWAVDKPTCYDRLDPFHDFVRMYEQPDFHTAQDEMDVQYLTSKYQYLTTFQVNANDTTGTLLMSRPITPMMSTMKDAATDSVLELISSCAQAWSGKLDLVFMSSMTSFQHFKLLVVADYSRDEYTGATVPTLNNLTGYPSFTLEFAGGGTMQCCTLDFNAITPHLPVTLDANANLHSHGVYYVFLLHPLSASPSQPTTAFVNVFVRGGEDFTLYGYRPIMWCMNKEIHPAPPPPVRVKQQPEKKPLPPLPPPPPRNSNTSQDKKKDASKKIADTQTEHMSEINTTTSQECVEGGEQRKKLVTTPGTLRPFTNLRDVIRRVELSIDTIWELTELTTTNALTFSVSQVMGLWYNKYNVAEVSPPIFLRNLFYGHVGGVKMKWVISGLSSASVYYVPPTPLCFANVTPPLPHYGGCLFGSSNETPSIASIAGTGIFSAPFIDHPNMVCLSSKTLSAAGSLESESTIVLEFEIPNCNPCNFVTLPITRDDDTITDKAFSSDMGLLYLTGKPSIIDDRGSNVPAASALVMHVGWSDEARFGMAVYSQPRGPAQSVTVDGGISYNYPGIPSRAIDRTNDVYSKVSKGYYTKTT